MGERAIKNTFIKFGLISIPVKLTTLVRPEEIRFHNLCPTCKSRISYKRWCENCQREVSYSEMLKGFEVSKSYGMVVLTKEQIEAMKRVEDEGIKIVGFVRAEDIPFYLFEKTYNLLPQRDKKGFVLGKEAFLLFKEALKISGLCAVGKMAMRSKTYLVAIRTYQDRLFISLLYYPHRISFPEKVEGEIREEELNLALELIDKLTYLNWNDFYTLENAKDEFREKMLRVLRNPKEIKVKEEVKKFKSLMEELKASVEMVKKKKEVS